MRLEPTGIEGITLIRLEPRADDRGFFARTFCEAELAAAGHPFQVAQANLSRNTRARTLRGLHLQRAPHGEPKIVSCTRGRIWDVGVDLRPESSTYRQWRAAELSPESGTALLLGEGIAHGFLTLEDDSDVHYLMGAPYVPGAATGVRWNDPALAIAWPAAPAAMSEADRGCALLDLRS